MRPGEILDAQVDLMEHLGDERFRQAVRALAAHHLGHAPTTYDWDEHPEMKREYDAVARNYATLPDTLANHLKVASAYRVTHDMSEMVGWMASQLEDTDAFYRVLMPTEAGIVCFDKPIEIIDLRNKKMLIHWVTWGPCKFGSQYGTRHDGTLMLHFNDTWRQEDEVQAYFREMVSAEKGSEAWQRVMDAWGRWATVGMDVVSDGQRMGPRLWEPTEEQRAQVAEDGFEAVPGTNMLRIMQALFLLLNQTVTTVADDHPDRPARRRAVRKGIPPQVSVIKLRRHDSEDMEPGESMVEWRHRWIVRRHWRWQPYGSRRTDCQHIYGPIEPEDGTLVQHCVHEGCDSRLVRIVINPYVKGPQGAPLVQSQKVYSLER